MMPILQLWRLRLRGISTLPTVTKVVNVNAGIQCKQSDSQVSELNPRFSLSLP